MNIIQPYAKILNLPDQAAGIALLRHIEWAARISHRSEDAQTETSYDRFLRAVVLNHGDWSVVEHASVTVDFMVDRGVTHELVRHRHFSFTQESTRFVNYTKNDRGVTFIQPGFKSEAARKVWEAVKVSEYAYKRLLQLGESPQVARSVLPNALASRLVMTGNLRNWRYLFQSRTSKETHPQMRQVIDPLLAEFQEKIPILFENIIPGQRQVEAFGKAR